MSLFSLPREAVVAEEVGQELRDPDDDPYFKVIRDIRHLIFILGEPPRVTGNAEDYFNQRELLRAHRYNNPIIVKRFAESAVIDFTSSSYLEDYSNKLLVLESSKAEVEYQRYRIPTGVSGMDSAPLRLSGYAELEEHDTISALQYCLGALTVHAAHGWGRSI